MTDHASYLRQLMRFAPPESSEEHRYVRTWLVRRREEYSSRLHVFGIVFNVIGILLVPFVRLEEMVTIRLAGHGGLILLALVWMVAVRFRPILMRPYVFVSQLMYAVTFGYILFARMGIDPAGLDTRMTPSIYALIAMYLLYFCPYDGWLSVLAALTYVGIAAGIAVLHPALAVWAVIVAVTIAGVMLLRFFLMNLHFREARTEYRARLKLAPRSVVRSYIESEGRTVDPFRSMPRVCACLCVEWVAERSGDLAGLAAFHGHCDGVLQEVVSGGNYYTDWIGRELFVVLFVPDGAGSTALADDAIDVARRFVAFTAGGFVQVGIATGTAHIGMMGPAACRKATAIGEVGGRARRLQSASVLFGAQGCAVFGEETRVQLRRAWDYQALVLSVPIRDVADEEIFHLAQGESPAELGRSG